MKVEVKEISDAFSNKGAIEIINYIKEITDKHPSDDIFVNITGGTNLMSVMALLGALYAGSKNIYYVLDPSKVDKNKEVILKFQLPRMRSALSNKQKDVFLGIGEYILEGKRNKENKDREYEDSKDSIIEIARYVYESDDSGISQRIKPHIDALESMNYITLKYGQNKRYQIIELTDAGKILYDQMKMDKKSIKKK
ncbi:MAG TPA: CRISPR-associated ring nuclease [bacterium]|nr:CRISPR-associated ring nuclease [bacterium]